VERYWLRMVFRRDGEEVFLTNFSALPHFIWWLLSGKFRKFRLEVRRGGSEL